MPIHRSVEVCFVGCQALVGQIGGVVITFDNLARDLRTYLDVLALPAAGAMLVEASVELLDQPAAARVLDAVRSGGPMDNPGGADSVHPDIE